MNSCVIIIFDAVMNIFNDLSCNVYILALALYIIKST